MSIEFIKVKGNKHYLDFRIQTTPSGKKMRYSGIRKAGIPFWDRKSNTEKSHWIYSFKLLDGGFIEFEFDYFDIFLKIVEKDSDVNELK